MNRYLTRAGLIVVAATLTACGGDQPAFEAGADAQGHTAPTAITAPFQNGSRSPGAHSTNA